MLQQDKYKKKFLFAKRSCSGAAGSSDRRKRCEKILVPPAFLPFCDLLRPLPNSFPLGDLCERKKDGEGMFSDLEYFVRRGLMSFL